MLYLPRRAVDRPDYFPYTVSQGIRGMWGSDKEPLLGRPVISVSTSFKDYVSDHREYAKNIIPKLDRRQIIHGLTNGFRSDADMLEIDALILDSDNDQPAPDLRMFDGLQYLFQYRLGFDKRFNRKVHKWHLVFPIADHFTGDRLTLARPWRDVATERFAHEVFGHELDWSQTAPCGVLLPYCRADEDDDLPRTEAGFGERLDLAALVEGLTSMRPRARKTTRIDESGVETNSTVEAFRAAGLEVGPKTSRGWAVRCPFDAEHSDPGKSITTSTIVTLAGSVNCKHSHCASRTQAEFASRLPGLKDTSGMLAQLEANRTEKVSVAEAQAKLKELLIEARPSIHTAAVGLVTAGTGKSFLAAAHLDDYCAPVWDEVNDEIRPGLRAVFAADTNDLMRDFGERLKVDHVKATGILSVLNDDGTPACKKHEQAKRLQAAGGDVHRLMCHRCQYREGCPARTGTRKGEGSLTITNHTLMPAIVRELGAGSVPLLVWDECPPLLEVVELSHNDIEWMVKRFDLEESSTRSIGLEGLTDVDVFPSRYRIALRPLVEILRRLRAAGTIEAATAAYASTRVSESHLARAAALSNVKLTGDAWDQAKSVAKAATFHNLAEWSFDALWPEVQEIILKASRLGQALHTLLDADDLKCDEVGLQAVGLAEAGRLWRDRGGVLLDATAPVEVLKAIRPDTRVERIAVEDAGTVLRMVSANAGLSRKALDRYKRTDHWEVIYQVTAQLRAGVEDLARRLNRKPRVVIFTYQKHIDAFKPFTRDLEVIAEVEWHYFGNTRGYNDWYDRDFDVFATFGDPYNNLGVTDVEAGFLGLDADAYARAVASSELAQAHGRARDPQKKRSDGVRLHFHWGSIAPGGWDSDNTRITK